MRLLPSPLAYPYPTGTSLVAQVCLGVGLGLSFVATVAYSTGAREGLLWLLSPAFLALVSAWALGPGMGEEIRIDPDAKEVRRCVFTLGVPQEKTLFPRGRVRIVANALARDTQGQDVETYLVLIDQRGSWLVLSSFSAPEKARQRRDHLAQALGVPGVEVRCSSFWTPYWGRVQPPPPPDVPRLKAAGIEYAEN